jgi:hypothetical protein
VSDETMEAEGLDGERLEGMPRLERQERPATVDVHGRPLVPQRVPELAPTPLQGSFIYLSIVALFCGVVAIVALELGTPLGSPWVKVPVLLGGAVLLAVTADALVRVWRSVGAWWDVERGRAWFRLVWVAVLAASLLVIGGIMLVALVA